MRRRLPSAGLQPCRRRKRWCTPNTAPTTTTTQPTTTRTPRQSHGRTAPRTGRSEPTARPSCSRPPSASASGPRTRCSSRRPSGTRAWRSCCSRSSRAGAPSHHALAFTLNSHRCHSHLHRSSASRSLTVGRPELTRYDLGFGAAVAPGLTEHAHRVWTDENAGGSSRNSEAMSMELLRHADTLSGACSA